MTPKEPKQPLPAIKEIADFKSKLKKLEGIQFESLQEYLQALDKLYFNQSQNHN